MFGYRFGAYAYCASSELMTNLSLRYTRNYTRYVPPFIPGQAFSTHYQQPWRQRHVPGTVQRSRTPPQRSTPAIYASALSWVVATVLRAFTPGLKVQCPTWTGVASAVSNYINYCGRQSWRGDPRCMSGMLFVQVPAFGGTAGVRRCGLLEQQFALSCHFPLGVCVLYKASVLWRYLV
jgi:hypothetical protein